MSNPKERQMTRPQEVARLVERLEAASSYVSHDGDCACLDLTTKPCDCGLHEVMRDLPEDGWAEALEALVGGVEGWASREISERTGERSFAKYRTTGLHACNRPAILVFTDRPEEGA